MSTATVKCSQCNIVINELLCFIQNKIDVLDEESIVGLCTSAFAASEVDIAKDLLFASISTTFRNIARRKNKEQKDLEDIISAFKSTDPDKTPIFVARELHKLPPVTFNHLDTTRLLKDIVSLQCEIKCIKETYATNDQLCHLRTEISNMKYASLLNCDDNNINKKRGAYNVLDSGPTGFLNFSSTPPTVISTPEREPIDQRKLDVPCSVSRQLSQQMSNVLTSNVSFAPAVTAGRFRQNQKECASSAHTMNATTSIPTYPSTVSQLSDAAMNNTATNSVSCASINNNKTMAGVVQTDREWKPERPSEKWIEVQRKRHRNKTEGITGKAVVNPGDKFKPADVKVPLFISNVHKDTSENDILKYIHSKTSENVLLQRIKMKSERDFNAYKMLVARHKLDTYLNDEIWPIGVTCRRFMPYINRLQEKEIPTPNNG